MTHLKLKTFSRHRLLALTVTVPVSIALWVSCAHTHAQTVGENPREVLPSQDTKELVDLVNLDDRQLQARINTDWNRIRETLDRFSPPASAANNRNRQGFAGPQQACLQNRLASACRTYMRELIELNKQKEQQGEKEQQGGSLLLNPWGATPR